MKPQLYGFSCGAGEVRITLLRSPPYLSSKFNPRSVSTLDLALRCDFKDFEIKTILLEQNRLSELAGLDV